MGLPCCFGGTAFQTLRLAAIPSYSFSSSSILRPFPRTQALDLLYRHHFCLSSPLHFVAGALSASATQTIPVPNEATDKVVQPQWKAAVDFKWIRDNKEAVASNIKKRNSTANLDIVLELYEKLTNLQKIAGG